MEQLQDFQLIRANKLERYSLNREVQDIYAWKFRPKNHNSFHLTFRRRSVNADDLLQQVELIGEPEYAESADHEELGIYVPKLKSVPLGRLERPLAVHVNYLNFVDGASSAEIGVPITIVLKQSLDRDKDTSRAKVFPLDNTLHLHIDREFTTAEEQHALNSSLWLGVLALHEASSKRGVSVSTVRNQEFISGFRRVFNSAIAGAGVGMGSEILMPSGNVKTDILTGALFSTIGISYLRMCGSYIQSRLNWRGAPDNASDAETYLYSKKLIASAEALAAKQPVLSPQL